jgi:hypothetical protein
MQGAEGKTRSGKKGVKKQAHLVAEWVLQRAPKHS